jgi:LysR family transcriptional regulator, transcription activator of glutamate synthase operon
MELRHLIYFEAVVRHQSVTRAAQELMIAQPAVTKQLHDLERELGGGALFEKVGRNLRLTETGKGLLTHTRTILAQIEALKAEMRERGELRQGRVTMGVPASVGERLLPKLLETFHRRYPALELRMYEANSRTSLELMYAGEIDLAVITKSAREHKLWITPLFKEQLVLVVSLQHRLATQKITTFSELADEPFLLYSPGSVREQTLSACRTAGFEPRVVLDGGAVEMLLRLAEAGLGVAVVPQSALEGKERLAVLQLTEPALWRTMALASREDRALTPAALALRTFLEEHLVRQPDK